MKRQENEKRIASLAMPGPNDGKQYRDPLPGGARGGLK